MGFMKMLNSMTAYSNVDTLAEGHDETEYNYSGVVCKITCIAFVLNHAIAPSSN